MTVLTVDNNILYFPKTCHVIVLEFHMGSVYFEKFVEMPKITEEEDSKIVVKRKLGGLICRLEPNNIEWILKFPRSAQLMKNTGWFSFCENLQGYHSQVTMDFIKNYKDGMVQLKSLKIMVNEESISEAIDVPMQGERWFKQQEFQGDYSEFLILGFEKLDWKNGIHVSKIKPNWKIPLQMVQNYMLRSL